MRSAAATAELALHLEAAAAPTPGNVDRERDHDDLRLEQFLAGAVGAREGLSMAADGEPVGAAFETAVEGMSQQSGGNTQFGALLLLVPLVATAGRDEVLEIAVTQLADETTVDDAAAFYRAFDHVGVRVDEPPESFEPLDVRRGSDAIPALRDRGLTLQEVLVASADRDGVAREWTNGFERTFQTASLLSPSGADTEQSTPAPGAVLAWIDDADSVLNRAARVHLYLLSEQLDSLIVTAHDKQTAKSVRERAATLLPTASPSSNETAGELPDTNEIQAFAVDLVDRGINPGMTADHLAAGLFVALQRGELTV